MRDFNRAAQDSAASTRPTRRRVGAAVLALLALFPLSEGTAQGGSKSAGQPCGSHGQCQSGLRCKVGDSPSRKVCTSPSKACGVPSTSPQHKHGINHNELTSIDSSNRTYGNVPTGIYRCVTVGGQSRLYPKAGPGQRCEVDGQCTGTTYQCNAAHYQLFSGSTGVLNNNTYCTRSNQCIRPNGSVASLNDKIGSGAQGKICQTGNHGGTWYAAVPNNEVVARHSNNQYSILESPKYGVSVHDPQVWCASGKAQRWLDDKHWVCLPDDKDCVRLGQPAVSGGANLSLGGKQYRCAPQQMGWRLEDGQRCSADAECGVMSKCSANPAS